MPRKVHHHLLRRRVLSCRVNEHEWTTICHQAARRTLKVADYVRHQLLEVRMPQAPIMPSVNFHDLRRVKDVQEAFSAVHHSLHAFWHWTTETRRTRIHPEMIQRHLQPSIEALNRLNSAMMYFIAHAGRAQYPQQDQTGSWRDPL